MSAGWPNRHSIGGFVTDVDDSAGGTDFRMLTKVTGWDDAPPVRLTTDERMGQDGGYDSTPLLGPRVITLEGMVDQATAAAARSLADALTGLQVGQRQLFAVDNDAMGSRTAWCRIAAGAVLEWDDDVSFHYTIQLVAPDPRKYGLETFTTTQLAAIASGSGLAYPLAYPLSYGAAAAVVPGTLSLSNAGTVSYHPRLRITGPVPNPIVTCAETGDWIRYNGTIVAGSWLDIDCGARSVLLNGVQSVRGSVTFSGAWLAVPVGGASLSWTADAADPAALLTAWFYTGAWT